MTVARFVGVGVGRRKLFGPDAFTHSEWNRRLGVCSLLAIGAVFALSLLFGLLLNNLFAVAESAAPPLAAVALASLVFWLTAQQLACLARRWPVNGPLYNLAFATHSEGLAFSLGWLQLVEGASLTAVLANLLASFMRLLFNHKIEQVATATPPPTHIVHVDVLAIVLVGLAVMFMLCSLRVLSTVSIVFLVALLFTATSTTVVAMLHNVVHLRVHYISFPYSFAEVNSGTQWLLIGIMCLECLSMTNEETENPRKVVPQVTSFLAKSMSVVLLLAVLAFFPFSYRRHFAAHVPLPVAFDTIGIFSARYLLNVGSVCGLSAGLAASFLTPSRVLNQMARDGVIPCGKLAVLIAGLISVPLTLLPSAFLCNAISTSVAIRTFIQSVLLFNTVYWTDADEDSGQRYDELRRSSESNITDDPSLCDLPSDEDSCLENVWKVTASSTEETHLMGCEPKSYSAIGRENKAEHNCLTSSCSTPARLPRRWPDYHVYDVEEQYDTPRKRRATARSERRWGVHKTGKNARRALTLLLMLSTLIAVSHAIIRETVGARAVPTLFQRGYVPVLPIVSLVTGVLLACAVLTWTSCNKPCHEAEKWIPVGAMGLVFIMTQLFFSLRLPVIIAVVGVYVGGLVPYTIYVLCKS